MSDHNDLRNEQARQLIDAEQVYATYRDAWRTSEVRYAGSMSWKTISGGHYLYRKSNGSNHSLGPRSDLTENAYRAFHEGRERFRERLSKLSRRLDEMAPVNKALGLGRVPTTSARILRHVGVAGLLGKALHVVGTNALFAYERLAGVQIASGQLATTDMDLLFDSRRNLKLASISLSREGLLGLLHKVDRSFAPIGRGAYRAVNNDGFMVDLIKPMPKSMPEAGRTSIGDQEDLQAVEIAGLAWLVNSPKHEVMVLDERGYPLQVSVPDGRAFAMHKAWLSARDDRDPVKRKRDLGQARLVASLFAERLPHLRFDGPDLSALPVALRRAADGLLRPRSDHPDHEGPSTPDW